MFDRRKLANFLYQVKIKVAIDAYGYDIPILCRFGCSILSYQRRFPVVLFDLIGIARPPFVNETTEVCVFYVSILGK